MKKSRSLFDRLMSKARVDSETGCWLWTASTNNAGYGQIGVNGKVLRAHRVSYELAYGPIAEGMYVLHDCDTPTCINPAHLHLGTQADNMREKVERGRTGGGTGKKKLTATQVMEIRAALSEGATQTSLAATYGVTRVNICLIANGKTWQNLMAQDDFELIA